MTSVRPYRRRIPSGQDAPVSGVSERNRGDVAYWDGTGWRGLSKGNDGEVLIVTNGIPAWKSLSAAGIAPNDLDFLVGTATGDLTSEIVAGTTPQGELGGTWGSPTVDATHSGSAHTDFIAKAFVDAKGDLISASADNTPAIVTAGANDTILMADSAQSAGLKWVAAATPAAVGTSGSEGTADSFTRGDHVHAHEAAHINHDTTWAAQGDLIVATANDTAAVLSIGTSGQVLTVSGGTAAWATASSGVTGLFYVGFGSETNEGQAVTP